MELVWNFKLLYKLISEVDKKTYSLAHLVHMIVFLLDRKVINGIPRGLILGLLFLLIYFNDVLKVRDNDATVVLFAGDTRITVTTSNQEGVQTV